MGQKVFCYLTGYRPNFEALKESMQGVGDTLALNGVKVLRMKIEQIVFDTATNYNECPGNCAACPSTILKDDA